MPLVRIEAMFCRKPRIWVTLPVPPSGRRAAGERVVV